MKTLRILSVINGVLCFIIFGWMAMLNQAILMLCDDLKVDIPENIIVFVELGGVKMFFAWTVAVVAVFGKDYFIDKYIIDKILGTISSVVINILFLFVLAWLFFYYPIFLNILHPCGL
jgi:hypothetical protein